mgnify:CR=1 FL=1
MKNLIYLFLTLLIVACGKTVNEREEGQYLTREKKVQYYKGIPFSGTLVKDDEWSIETREFKEGLLDGVTEFYYSYKIYAYFLAYILILPVSCYCHSAPLYQSQK